MIQIGDLPEPEKQAQAKIKNGQVGVINIRNLPNRADKTWDFLVRMGNIDGNVLEPRNYSNIKDSWRGEPCYIFGAGPPLREVIAKTGWEPFIGKHTIGINHVIEDWDGFEWFLFLDRRFRHKTTYDLSKYAGRIFAQCTTGLKMKDNVVIFHTQNTRPSSRLEDGLYNGNFGGLAALNLALITGAAPIYLLGYGMGTEATAQAYHYKPDYTGEVKRETNFQKFIKVQRYYERFKFDARRIVHVTDGKDIPVFLKMPTAAFAAMVIKEKKVALQEKRIIHLSFSSDLNVHAEITRHVVGECQGKHSMVNVNSGKYPAADLYVLEHFLSTDKAAKTLPISVKAKTIAVIHTAGCLPGRGFKRVITITAAWQKILARHGVKSTLIRGGIDLKPFIGIEPDYNAKIFGRMTRWSQGKINQHWNQICAEILEEMPETKCLFFVDKANEGGRPKLQHPRMKYSDECKISMDKAPFLRRLSIYVHTNGTFRETMSHSCIEAMACGLPVVYLTEGTGVLEEVVGPGGIRCATMGEVKAAVMRLLNDPAESAEIGKRGREQAKLWDKDRMVKEYDILFKECAG